MFFVATSVVAQTVKLKVQSDGPKKIISLKGEPVSTYHMFRSTNISRWNPEEYVTVYTDEQGYAQFAYQDESRSVFYTAKKMEDHEQTLTLDKMNGEVVLTDGQEEDVAHYSFDSSAQVKISSFKIDFAQRFWLYVSTVSIMDGQKIIATQTNLNEGNFLEIVSGSQYRLYLPALAYTVQVGSTQHLTMHVKMKNGIHLQSTGLNILSMQIRTIDDNGFSHNSINEIPKTFAYFNSDNGRVVVTLDPASPPSRIVLISQSAQTHNVMLARFGIVSLGIDSMLNRIIFDMHTERVSTKTLFKDVKIVTQGQTHSVDTLDTDYLEFSALAIQLPANQYVSVSVYGDVNPDVNGTTLTGSKTSVSINTNSSLVLMNNPDVLDQKYQSLYVDPSSITSETITFMSLNQP